MREIKFRCWDGKEMKPHFDISQNPIYWEGFIDGALMQYIGLKDKNGVEIYEGDIVKSEGILNDSFNVVCYEEINASFIGKPCSKGLFIPLYGKTLVESEVVGNIYENESILGV